MTVCRLSLPHKRHSSVYNSCFRQHGCRPFCLSLPRKAKITEQIRSEFYQRFYQSRFLPLLLTVLYNKKIALDCLTSQQSRAIPRSWYLTSFLVPLSPCLVAPYCVRQIYASLYINTAVRWTCLLKRLAFQAQCRLSVPRLFSLNALYKGAST